MFGSQKATQGVEIDRSSKAQLRVTPSIALVALFISAQLACVSAPAEAPIVFAEASNADDILTVDCLLPGKVRKLGSGLTYLSARRPVKTSGQDCEIRGGEYTSYDRANYQNALAVWMEQANQGDPTAQTYVGEIYEKGLGREPDYEMAALWYRRAAEQGFVAAQISLGQLYELGLGVPQDPQAAVAWYRKAAAFEGVVEFIPAAEMDAREQRAREFRRLQVQIAKVNREAEVLQQELEAERSELGHMARKLDLAIAAGKKVEADRAQLVERQQQLESKQRELARLDVAIEDKAKQLTKRKHELSAKEVEMAQLDAEVLRISSIVRDLWVSEQGLKDKQKEAGRLSADIARLQSEKANLVEARLDEVGRLDSTIADLEKTALQLAIGHQAVALQQAMLADLRAEIDGLSDDRAWAAAEKQAEISTLSAQIDELNRTVASLSLQEAELANKRAELAFVEDDISRLVGARRRIVEDRQAETERLGGQIAFLSEKLNQLASATPQAQAELVELEQKISRAEEQRQLATAAKQSEIDRLTSTIGGLNKSYASLLAREEEVGREYAKLADAKSDLDLLTAKREQALEMKGVELAQRNRQIEALNARLIEQAAPLAAQDRALADKQLELASLNTEIDALRLARGAAAEDKHNEITRLGKVIAGLSTQVTQLDSQKEELKQKQAEVARLNNMIEDLTARAEELRPDASLQLVAIAGPSIEILDPRVVRTRGVNILRTSVVNADRIIVGRVVAPAGITALTVNGIETVPAANGIFKANVRIPTDGATIRVVAVDNRGERDTVEFRLLPGEGELPAVSAGPASLASSINFGNYYALVIGNNNYEHLPDLKTAHNDAQSISLLLERDYGFKVTTLLDATRRRTLTSMEELRRKLTPEDNLLIYYAGHGELDEINSRGNWLPVDAEPDNAAQWISNMDLTGILNRTTAKHILVVADSCYAATLTRGALSNLAGGMSEDNRAEWIKQMTGKRSVTVLSSGADEPVLDGGGTSGHSIFAQALLNVLEENMDVLAGQSLHIALAAKVAYRAAEAGLNQTPQYAPIRYSGHAFGDFFFVRDVDKRRVGLAPFKMLARVSP